MLLVLCILQSVALGREKLRNIELFKNGLVYTCIRQYSEQWATVKLSPDIRDSRGGALSSTALSSQGLLHFVKGFSRIGHAGHTWQLYRFIFATQSID